MSLYQNMLIVVLFITALLFALWFRRYSRKAEVVGQPDYKRRRQSSLAANGDVDSEDALEDPVTVNKDVLNLTA